VALQPEALELCIKFMRSHGVEPDKKRAYNSEEADDKLIKMGKGRLAKKQIDVPAHALWDEINHLLFMAEIVLIDLAVKNFGRLTPQLQTDAMEATYYPKRKPQDSQLDPNKTIAEQFNLMRICDPNRFPAFFMHLGERYIVKLEKSVES
jgi:methionyl-tRNA formyltransferase